MTGLGVATPVGWPAPPPSGPEFNVFVLLSLPGPNEFFDVPPGDPLPRLDHASWRPTGSRPGAGAGVLLSPGVDARVPRWPCSCSRARTAAPTIAAPGDGRRVRRRSHRRLRGGLDRAVVGRRDHQRLFGDQVLPERGREPRRDGGIPVEVQARRLLRAAGGHRVDLRRRPRPGVRGGLDRRALQRGNHRRVRPAEVTAPTPS